MEKPGNICIRSFLDKHFRHFNSAVVVRAAKAYCLHLDWSGKMLITLAGAMSTAEIGKTLAEMIRQDKVHALSVTGANLEEELFNLIAHKHYKMLPDYRNLTADNEQDLFEKGLNRVTDTCIPEEKAMRRIERELLVFWKKAELERRRLFPYEYIYQLIRSKSLEKHYEINPKNSWLLAACEKNLPIFTPGWEDSTLGNMFVAYVRLEELSGFGIMKSGLEQMDHLIDWYKATSENHSVGFFQVGGGIAGDFAICVVPLILQDLKEDCKKWGYFCQISDSTTSYGSYSGAIPNEKISWGKLDKDTPAFVIESDASIVAPLMFAYILGY